MSHINDKRFDKLKMAGIDLKILMLVDEFSDGGAQRVVVDLCNASVGVSGVSVSLAVARNCGLLKNVLDDHIHVEEFGEYRNLHNIFSLRKKIKNICKKHGINVIVSNISQLNKSVILANCFPSRICPVVVVEHADFSRLIEKKYPTIISFLRKLFIKKIYSMPDAIVTVSSGVKQQVFQALGNISSRIEVIHNPISTTRKSISQISPVIHKKTSGKILISAGRFEHIKNFHGLIEAFNLVVKKRQEHRDTLVILGDGRWRSALENMIREYNLVDRIILPGFVEDPFQFFENADLFVSASFYEAFGNAMVEAISSGCPCLATPTTGAKELAKHMSCIQLTDGFSLVNLAAAIQQEFDRPSLTVLQSDLKFIDGLSPDYVLKNYIKVCENVTSQ